MAKEYKHIDPQLMERGWAAMENLLDNEMPVEKKRRRFLIFWMLGFLLIATIGGAAYYWQSLPAKSNPTIPTTHTIVGKEIAEEPALIQPEAKHTNPVSTPTPSSLRLNQNIQVSEIKSPVPVSTLEQNPNSASQFSELPPNNHAIPSELMPLETTVQNTPETPPQIDRAKAPALAPINPLQINITPPVLPQKNTEPMASVSTITKKAGQNRFKPGVYASTQWSNTTQQTASSVGVQLDWNINRKIGLRLGAGYQYGRIIGQNRPIVSISGLDYYNISGDSTVLGYFPGSSGSLNPSTNQNPTNVLVPINRLHRLELPIQLVGKVGPRWRVLTGVQLQYLFYTKNAGSTLSLAQNTVNDAFTNERFEQPLNSLVSGQTRGWDNQWTIALGYQLNKHLEFNLGYRRQLSLSSLALRHDLDASYSEALFSADVVDAPNDLKSSFIYLNANYKF
jgi:hypothetical protein